jgi:hypothetical protein
MTRQQARRLAHSYRDELPEPFQWEPYTFHWTHVVKFVVGVILTYGLFVALLIIGTAAS